MDAFLINISSFPTAIYTTGLVVVIGYWIIAFFGNFDFEAFDVGIDVDLDIDGESSEVGRIAGLLSTLGLTGVPISVVITFLILNAWFVCYFANLLVPNFPDVISAVQTLIEIGIAITSFLFSIFLTNLTIRPLKGIFRKLNQDPISKSLLGSTCRIRSSRADSAFGEAECQHEGASLIIKVRAEGNAIYCTDDIVVILDYNEHSGTFIIVSEKEFKVQINN